jgi:hypothetical protein
MKKLTPIWIAVLLSSLSISHADTPPDKRAEIQKLIRLTGVERLVGQMETQILSSMKAQMPQVPDLFWIKFQQKINNRELIEKIIPLYDKFYTTDDLKAINAFYETPVGAKVLSTLPQLTQESMKIGQEWGEKISRQAAQEADQELKTKPPRSN